MARTEQSIEINVPPWIAYEQLTRFEQYPRFMQDVQEVRRLDERHLRWRMKMTDTDAEWDAEITQQVPERCIAWQSLSGPHNEGRMDLAPVDGDRTRVTMTVESDAGAEAGMVRRAADDLVRLKQFLEKLARDSGHWRGREQEAAPSHSAPAEMAAGTLDHAAPDLEHHVLPDAQSQADYPDAPQQPFGADEADNSRPGARTDAGADAGTRPPPWLAGFRQAWEEPLSTVRRMSEEMEQMLGRLASGVTGAARSARGGNGWMPAVDIVRCPDRILVSVEVPGIPREQIQVEVVGSQLVIEGSRPRPHVEGAQEQYRGERAYGGFRRQLSLPDGAAPDAISAVLKDGVLELAIPLRQRDGPARRIEIGEG